jgi:hypothetical protein
VAPETTEEMIQKFNIEGIKVITINELKNLLE